MNQLVANAAISAAIILLVGVGFALIYRVGRFFHFAHGAAFTAGAYMNLVFFRVFGLPQPLSATLSVLTCIALGCTMELAVYRPLRKRSASGVVQLVASLGLYILLTSLISLAFGDQTESVRSATIAKGVSVAGARLTDIQITIIACAAVVASMVAYVLRYTKAGREFRAVASDPELAAITGVRPDRVILGAFAVGSGLAGIAGILVSLDVDMRPTMGLLPLLSAVVAVLVGGVGRVLGLVMGAILIASAQNVGGWYLGQQWREPVVFVVLLGFLFVRPEGVMGKKLTKATV